jgi:signal transduction histidine kinase
VDLQVGTARGMVTVLVADDGAGGADRSLGSGLNGAVDRIGALGGRLVMHSPPGGGTRLVAEIPVATSLADAAPRLLVTASL